MYLNSRFLIALVASAICFGNAFGQAAQPKSCGCQVPDAKEKAYDKELWLNQKDKNLALEAHLPWGAPEGANGGRILIQRDYVVFYDDNLLVPIWTAHRLRKADLKKRSRLECFRRDVRVPDKFAGFCTDYDEPIYDRGHMVPNGDMTRTEVAMINTYMFTNMSPQHCAFNRGIWQQLEELVRHWAETKGEIYVITGIVLDRDGNGSRDTDDAAERMLSRNKKQRVAIPSHHYKILVHQNADGSVESLSILMPNLPKKVPVDDSKKYLEDHIQSIEAIEKVTGLSFFGKAAAANASAVAQTKKTKAASLWPVTRSWPGPLDSGCKE